MKCSDNSGVRFTDYIPSSLAAPSTEVLGY